MALHEFLLSGDIGFEEERVGAEDGDGVAAGFVGGEGAEDGLFAEAAGVVEAGEIEAIAPVGLEDGGASPVEERHQVFAAVADDIQLLGTP